MPLKGTLSGSYAAPITLTGAGYSNPVTVTGTISLASAGIDLQAASAWSIFNAGAIEGPASAGGYGISLGAGGYVSNASGGTIASRIGIDVVAAAATVVNAGTISGAIDAVIMTAGGSVTNATGGFIQGSNNDGVLIAGGAGSVGNAGTITGGAATLNAGVELIDSGVVTNSGSIGGAYGVVLEAGGSVTNIASAVIQGGADVGLWIGGGMGTVSNAGTIINSGVTNSAIALHDGGSIENPRRRGDRQQLPGDPLQHRRRNDHQRRHHPRQLVRVFRHGDRQRRHRGERRRRPDRERLSPSTSPAAAPSPTPAPSPRPAPTRSRWRSAPAAPTG